jgi:hypothetical protein
MYLIGDGHGISIGPEGSAKAIRNWISYTFDPSRGGICCTDQVLPSGSLKKVNQPHGCLSTGLALTPRPMSSCREAFIGLRRQSLPNDLKALDDELGTALEDHPGAFG